MLRLSKARAWENLRIIHTCGPRTLGKNTFGNAVPVLETLVLCGEVLGLVGVFMRGIRGVMRGVVCIAPFLPLSPRHSSRLMLKIR